MHWNTSASKEDMQGALGRAEQGRITVPHRLRMALSKGRSMHFLRLYSYKQRSRKHSRLNYRTQEGDRISKNNASFQCVHGPGSRSM